MVDQSNSGNGKYNGDGSGNGYHHENGDNDRESGETEDNAEDNIVRIPTLAERDKARREQEKLEKDLRKQYRKDHPGEPLINLPPVTKIFLIAFLAIHIITDLVISPVQQFWIINHFGFVPAVFTGAASFSVLNLLGPVTYIFLHGSWMHLAMNGLMMMAFGSGVERWMGSKRFLIFFIACSLVAVLIHFLTAPYTSNPVIGASGGLSGLFAAVLIMLQQMGRLPTGKYGILPFILLWVGISVVFGMLGGPDGSTVAWIAHIGGFLAGFVLLKPVMRMKG